MRHLFTNAFGMVALAATVALTLTSAQAASTCVNHEETMLQASNSFQGDEAVIGSKTAAPEVAATSRNSVVISENLDLLGPGETTDFNLRLVALNNLSPSEGGLGLASKVDYRLTAMSAREIPTAQYRDRLDSNQVV